MDELSKSRVPHFQVLGVNVNELTLPRTIEVIDDWISSDRRDYIVVTGAHGVIEMQDDQRLKEINNNAGLVTPDGMPNVWSGKFKGFRNTERVTGSEVMEECVRVSPDRGYRHFLYGGKEGVADKLKQVLEEKYPGIQIVGTYCPPFRPLTPEERDDVVERINASEAHIVWCGLGCPKQERWMADFRPLVDTQVLIGVGAAFDFLTGEVARAPQWVSQWGLEWFFRTLHDPGRLIKRYGKIVPRYIYLNLIELVTGRFFGKL